MGLKRGGRQADRQEYRSHMTPTSSLVLCWMASTQWIAMGEWEITRQSFKSEQAIRSVHNRPVIPGTTTHTWTGLVLGTEKWCRWTLHWTVNRRLVQCIPFVRNPKLCFTFLIGLEGQRFSSSSSSCWCSRECSAVHVLCMSCSPLIFCHIECKRGDYLNYLIAGKFLQLRH